MKTIIILLFPFLALGQSPVGIWKNIDDEDGKAKSHIEIYEQDGMLHGKVIKLLEHATLTLCSKCEDHRKDQPIEGMIIMNDLKKDGKAWDNGKILDPKSGKIYDCKIKLKKEDVLDVRGYIGVSLFGRTQSWFRVNPK